MFLNIRRPLVWLLIAYIVGIGLYMIKFSVVLLCVFFVMIFISIGMLLLYRKDRKKLVPFGFLLCIPFMILLGYRLMNKQMELPKIDSAFDNKAEGIIQGELEAVEAKNQYTLLTLRKNIVTLKKPNQKYYCNRLIIYSTSNISYKIGNILSASGQVVKFQKPGNPGQFNEYQYYKIRNIDYKVYSDQLKVVNNKYSYFYHSLYCLKKKLELVYQKILPPKDAGTISAMILGEMALLDEETKELYQESGISHILSISGLNVSLLGITLFTLLRSIGVPYFLSTALSVFILFSYGILTNFSVSTNRAVVMLVILMMAGLIGRTYDILSATSLSAIIILIQSPMQILNAGFLLSFGAILGIAIIYPILKEFIIIKNIILDAVLLNIGIQIITFPILLYFFFEFPIYSLVVNIVILPLSSLLILMAVTAGILGCFFIPFSTFLIGCVHYTLSFYEGVCRIASELPGRALLIGRPSLISLITYYMVILFFILINQGTKRKRSLLLFSFLMLILVKSKNMNLKVTFLDVGQGDGIFMEMPEGNTYLVDGGSMDVKKVGQYRIEPFLKSKGIWEIDYAIITHTDYDHISGIREIMENMEDNRAYSKIYEGRIVIRHLMLPDIFEKNETYMELIALAQSKGVEIVYFNKGDRMNEKKVTITCLHPSNDYLAASLNSYSAVFSINYNKFDLLLTGDLQIDGEELLMREFTDILKEDKKKTIGMVVDYDVLKIAHHGSKYSTTKEFLQYVKPEYSVISCGEDNRYGHPHGELLNRLENIKSNILITKDWGAITITTDGNQYKIVK